MTESSSAWKRFRSHFGWLDSIDALIYGGLGLALLGYTIHQIAGALLDSGQEAAFAAFVAFIGLTAASVVRDLHRRQLTALSKGFAGAWAVAVALVIVIELLDSFS